MTEEHLLELPQITIAGSPRDMGRSHGEQMREQIQHFVAHRLQAAQVYLDQRRYPHQADFRTPATQCLERLKEWHSGGFEEHQGVAEAANVHVADLYAAVNYSDIRDLLLLGHPGFARLPRWDEGCTAFAMPAALTSDGHLLTGQTWDLHPRDMEYVIAIHRLPDNGPETWSVTCAGSPTLIGMNEHGLYVGTTNIKIHGVQIGIPYLSLLHRAIGCASRNIAANLLSEAQRVAAHTYWLVDDDGAIELECAAHRVVRREMQTEPIWQTNHCLDPRHQKHEAEVPSESSQRRYDRAGQLLNDGGPHDVQTIKAMFADRSDDVHSINRYAEDGQYAATNSCVIAVPATRRLLACRGPADRGRWEHLAFSRISAAAT